MKKLDNLPMMKCDDTETSIEAQTFKWLFCFYHYVDEYYNGDLKAARRAHGITLNELAAKTGISRQTLAKVEEKTTYVQLETIIAYIDAVDY